MKVTKVILTTKNIAERNSEELIDFYETKLSPKPELEIKVQETPDEMIDIEFYGPDEESGEITLLDKVGIPYDKETDI
jgi:hypothetical protein